MNEPCIESAIIYNENMPLIRYMSRQDIESDYYEEFPGEGRIYLNNASISRMPTSTITAMSDFITEYNSVGPDSATGRQMVLDLGRQIRRIISNIIHCQPDEIVLTQSITDGVNIISNGLDVKLHNNVVIRDVTHEHHANSFPWLNLQAEHRILKVDQNGLFDIRDIESYIDNNTVVVALTHALYNTGAILPLEQVGRMTKGTSHFFVDAAQTMGNFGSYDFSRLYCDSMAFNGSKWLCGPMGTGLLYCSRKAASQLRPVAIGGESAMLYDNTKIAFKDMPDKFEAGYRNYAGLAGLAASLEYITGIGLDTIQYKNNKLSQAFRESISDMSGVTIYGPEDEHIGIVSFRIDNQKSSDVVKMLDERGVVVAQREIGDLDIVRVSPHFYNTYNEIDATVDIIKECL